MAIPNRFRAGEVASSSELNENFTYIENLVGTLSTDDELVPEKDLKFGSAGFVTGGLQLNLLPANKETNNLANAARGFINLSWNAKPHKTAGRWQRHNSASGASVIELGDYGIVMATTGRRSGDLQSQLTPILAVMNSDLSAPDAYHVYMDPFAPIKTTYKNPNQPAGTSSWSAPDVNQSYAGSLQRRRLTYVRFDEPRTVMENKKFAKGKQEINVLSHSVPKQAAMVELLVYTTATARSGAGMIVMPKMKSPHRKYGLICHSYGGNYANWGRSAVQGHVPVYSGLYKLKDGEYQSAESNEGGAQASVLILEATEEFSEVSIYIQGYYI